MKKIFGLFFIFILFTACGSGSENSNTVSSQPVLIAALPDSAAIGATVTLQGIGFSITPNENIVVVGGATAVALTHQFINPLPNGAIEEITFQIPSNAEVGSGNVFVLVSENPSNSIPFTVESP
jgi:hypothetical protein